MTDTKTEDLARGAALNKAAAAASAHLKAKYTDEWNKRMVFEAAALGQTWAPRLSAEEKEKAELLALLAKHPEVVAEWSHEQEPKTEGTPVITT